MNKNPLFKKDSDIFTHIFWVTLTAAMTVTTQRSYTVLPRHRDQSKQSHSREQHFTATRQRRTPPRRPVRWVTSLSQASHCPPRTVPPLPRQCTSSQATPELIVPMNKSDVNKQKMINLTRNKQKRKKQSKKKGDGYLWTMCVRQQRLMGREKRNHITTYVST